ncbi:DUF4375 domain-containing protein [Rhizobium sp. L43]|uniref:DMP19 family protein n=1 Tax=Rhizobium sp. L43 TaxID=2035452 RepID=UPI000BEA1697|nr:DUF4375 domain-containing protein [Rhizobium sp. L43]PDS80614.1 hypothetical protein CO667_03080 [Rhizobium sp. L43]
MRYVAALIAALIVVSTGVMTTSNAQVQMEASKLQALTTMSVEFVIETTFLPKVMRLRYDDDKTGILREIEALDADVRNLFWLSYLQEETPSGEMHRFFTTVAEQRKNTAAVKRLLIEQGQKETDEIVRDLGESSMNSDPSRHADAVAEALSEARLARQAETFRAAGALAARDAEADFSALDTVFGSKSDLQSAIAAYVERTPTLTRWVESARAGIDEEDRLHYLTGKLYSMDEVEIERLPKPLKQIFVVNYFNAEMLNGGVHQFFFNPSGQYAPEVAAALREIGLEAHADAVQRGIDMFSKPYPKDARRRRALRFGHEWGEWDDRLSALTGDVDDGEITPALISLAKRENLLPR